MSVTTDGHRIATLDLIRGVAVMGIFSVNVIGFAMPFNAYLNPAAYGGTSGTNLALWALNFIFIDGKMRGLFTLLFGASTLLVIQRAQAAERSPAFVHYSRMGWLLVFGLMHFFLVWMGDILILYAVDGMVLFLFKDLPWPMLIAAGLAFLVADFVMMIDLSATIAAAEAAARAPHASAAAIATYRSGAAFVMPLDPQHLAQDLSTYRSGWGDIIRHRLTDQLGDPLDEIQSSTPETLGSMLIGMALFKNGFLTGAWPLRRYAWIAAVGLGVSIPAYALIAWRTWSLGFAPSAVVTDFFLYPPPFRLMMMLGYAALIILLGRGGGWLAERIAAAGRAAFTNYLGTSLIAAAVFNGYGLGLYGRVDRFHAWLLAPLVWAIMLLWSKPWLERFRYGPFEWLWRSLARWHVQPMRLPTRSHQPRLG